MTESTTIYQDENIGKAGEVITAETMAKTMREHSKIFDSVGFTKVEVQPEMKGRIWVALFVGKVTGTNDLFRFPICFGEVEEVEGVGVKLKVCKGDIKAPYRRLGWSSANWEALDRNLREFSAVICQRMKEKNSVLFIKEKRLMRYYTPHMINSG